jgi:predicted hotdog family 3-hydroxylacyl-ACP dehydratase
VSDDRSRFPPIEKLVPHGPPIRALERLLDWAPGRATCELHVTSSMPFVEGDRLATLVTLEYMAQAVAACLGHEAYVAGGNVRVGMVIGVRQMKIMQPFIPVGTRLLVRVECIRGNEEVSTFRGETHLADMLVSTAHMTLFHGEHPPDAPGPGPAQPTSNE